ncbi:patatin-like phospholipase family protein [Psychrobacter fozii]|uniref:Patatin-like phospholipase n=1 Tax=Psychrobacter fozii TaxID=198480 RepID=A0A2V4UIV2_9GAMM|nr:patatin-like phospholipase family protein [Psychrobacter fozii]PYE40097.1 patatin-like phospholipase [Psychrobacter fozii]
MNNKPTKPYERVQLFSGGGSRFGYYLGSYAALVAHDLTPDMIIGTCGGSLSAYLVNLAPDPRDLQALMCSRELSRVIAAIRHVSPDEANRRLKMRYMTHALKRLGLSLSRQASKAQRHRHTDSYARLLDELQQLAMFRVDNEGQWLDELSSFASSENGSRRSNANTPEIAIIASRLYQAPVDGLYNEQLKLQELLFAPPRFEHSVSSLTDEEMRSSAHAFASERIHPSVKVETQWDFAPVVRASMADMYYLPPTYIAELGWCLGGVINLTPIELACQLGDSVFAETKAGYDSWLAAPAIQRVFGFDPNERLAAVHGYQPMEVSSHTNTASEKHRLHWLPFADNEQQLAGQNVQKRFNIKQMIVELIHSNYDGFVQQMQAQWQYGYQRTADYIQQHNL